MSKYKCMWILGATPEGFTRFCPGDAGYHLEEIEPGVRERRPNPFCPTHQAKADEQNAARKNDED